MADDLSTHTQFLAPKRVVIVDDSKSMRLWLRHILNNDTRLEVVGEAADATQARAVIKAVRPDVITLDIEMPGMNGIEFLDRLMRLNPLPVVMVSSATERGTDVAIQALSLGAVDCVVKPQMADLRRTQRELVRRVFSAACSRVSTGRAPLAPSPKKQNIVGVWQMPIVLIGASTGGVTALEHVLRDLNPIGPPVVIVQHMPAEFLVSFSKMLDQTLPQEVGILRHLAELTAGQVMLAPALGRTHSEISRNGKKWCGQVRPANLHDLHHPSVDVLFTSACDIAEDVIAVMLTGLGRDGAQGLMRLRGAGARTIGQDRDSCVVYGMPRAAFELGAVQQQLPLNQIGSAVNRLVCQHQLNQRVNVS